jgi:hypothetical protein
VEVNPAVRKWVLIGLVAAVALPLGWTVVRSFAQPGPVAVVEEFFAAIVSKDIDAAVALARDHPPEASLLKPEAIADGWSLVSADEVNRGPDADEATVRVRLAGPDGYADGEFLLERWFEGEWRLREPFVVVEVHPDPLLFLQVNDATVTAEHAGQPLRRYLLPGLYEFYSALPGGLVGQRMEPVMAFPAYAPGYETPLPEPYQVMPGRLTATGSIVAAVEEEIETLIDDCVVSIVAEPTGCPFASDGLIDTPDGRRIEDISSLEWRVDRYPEISLVDDRSEPWFVGFRVVPDTEGIVTLSGRGANTDGETERFTVECGIDVSRFVVLVDALGNPLVQPTGEGSGNTCHRDP